MFRAVNEKRRIMNNCSRSPLFLKRSFVEAEKLVNGANLVIVVSMLTSSCRCWFIKLAVECNLMKISGIFCDKLCPVMSEFKAAPGWAKLIAKFVVELLHLIILYLKSEILFR